MSMYQLMAMVEEEQALTAILQNGVNEHRFKQIFKDNMVHIAMTEYVEHVDEPVIVGFVSVLKSDHNLYFDCGIDLAVCV